MTEIPIDEDEIFTSVREAGKYAKSTGQALFVAIKKGELKAEKKLIRNKRNRLLEQWLIKRSDIDAYRKSKYNREKRKFAKMFA